MNVRKQGAWVPARLLCGELTVPDGAVDMLRESLWLARAIRVRRPGGHKDGTDAMVRGCINLRSWWVAQHFLCMTL